MRLKASPLGLSGFSAGMHDGETAYLIPAHDWYEQINVRQVKPGNGGGYCWPTDCHLVSPNELPLQIIPGAPKQPVPFVEGIGTKPRIVNFKRAQQLSMLLVATSPIPQPNCSKRSIAQKTSCKFF